MSDRKKATPDEIKQQWIEKAGKAFSDLLLSPSVTELDKLLMKGQFSR